MDRVGDDSGISVGEPNCHHHVGVEPGRHVERLRMLSHQPLPVGEPGPDDDRMLVELPRDKPARPRPPRPTTRRRFAYAI